MKRTWRYLVNDIEAKHLPHMGKFHIVVRGYDRDGKPFRENFYAPPRDLIFEQPATQEDMIEHVLNWVSEALYDIHTFATVKVSWW